MTTKITGYAITPVGLLILAAGLRLLKMNGAPQGVLFALPYVCIGIGCGLFGHGNGRHHFRTGGSQQPGNTKEVRNRKK